MSCSVMGIAAEQFRRQVSTCVRCHRPLKDPDSVAAGMGRVCGGRVSKSDCGTILDDGAVLNSVGTLEDVGLVCRRLEDGRLACNVPHTVKWHSPTGFDCGYGGSGPAELALNVLHQLMRPIPAVRGRSAHGGEVVGGVLVSEEALRLHQDFKFKFIATMPAAGGLVPIEVIMEWLTRRIIAEAA